MTTLKIAASLVIRDEASLVGTMLLDNPSWYPYHLGLMDNHSQEAWYICSLVRQGILDVFYDCGSAGPLTFKLFLLSGTAAIPVAGLIYQSVILSNILMSLDGKHAAVWTNILHEIAEPLKRNLDAWKNEYDVHIEEFGREFMRTH